MIGGYTEGLPVQIPMIDIQEVGTGGGSIARIGAGGSLRVGPQSAGSQPGPVCYGLGGTEPTVTDANLILGRLSAARFLGGDMRLDFDSARDLRKLTSGPGRLCEALEITRERDNAKDMVSSKSDLQVVDDGFRVSDVVITPRIGITKSAAMPLRYTIDDNPFVTTAR